MGRTLEPRVDGGRRYHLQRRVGAGSFGEVWLAELDSGSGFRRPVAVKLLDEGASRNREAVRRLRDEARLLGRLRDRHIVDVIDLVELDGRHAVVMEYVAGVDLDGALRAMLEVGRTFSGVAACEVALGVCRALSAAWSADDGAGRPLRVVHRDIKPSNLRLSVDGEIKVLDFGVARFEHEAREAQTRKPGWIGTERYMAPERILLEGDGPPGDIYALGATLIELLIGRPLGRTPVREDAHARMVEEALGELLVYGRDGGPEALTALLRAMVAARPEARPDAWEVVAEVGRVQPLLEGERLVDVAAWVRVHVPDDGSDAGPGRVLYERRTGPVGGLTRPAAASWIGAGGAAGALAVGLGWAGWAWVLAPVPPPVDVAVVSAVPAAHAGPDQEAPAPPDPPPTVVVTPAAAERPPEAELSVDPPGDRSPSRPPRPRQPARATAGATTPSAPPSIGTPAGGSAAAATSDGGAGPVERASRVSRALFVVEGAESFTVRCGDRAVTGTATARITDFVGACVVHAELAGEAFTAPVAVDGPREVRCAVTAGGLRCS